MVFYFISWIPYPRTWHSFLNAREEKEEAPLKTGEEAARQLHPYTTFYPLQWWISLNPSMCGKSVGRLGHSSSAWSWQVEIFGLNSDAGKAFNGQKAANSNTIDLYQWDIKRMEDKQQGKEQGRCVCFMLLITTTFPNASRLEEIIERANIPHELGNLGIKPPWNFWRKISTNCCTGCVDGVLQRQRPLGSYDFPGEGQVDLKLCGCADVVGRFVVMIFKLLNF